MFSAAVAAIDSAVAIKFKTAPVPFSREAVLDCAQGSSDGCSGGYVVDALRVLGSFKLPTVHSLLMLRGLCGRCTQSLACSSFWQQIGSWWVALLIACTLADFARYIGLLQVHPRLCYVLYLWAYSFLSWFQESSYQYTAGSTGVNATCQLNDNSEITANSLFGPSNYAWAGSSNPNMWVLHAIFYVRHGPFIYPLCVFLLVTFLLMGFFIWVASRLLHTLLPEVKHTGDTMPQQLLHYYSSFKNAVEIFFDGS